jgi:hypothetical protein
MPGQEGASLTRETTALGQRRAQLGRALSSGRPPLP